MYLLVFQHCRHGAALKQTLSIKRQCVLWQGPSSYSTEVDVISAKWAGFSDPHSGLDYFRVGLGSSPGLSDIVPFVHVGRQTCETRILFLQEMQ